ncbi:10 kDa chaperonin 1, chloroplastic isoform X2 [Musa acuminata AAA Group]|uniref:10 kDa chaperonin 1, chloroplastic isoform X2 n=1 Tax=Musa acuminata AAA Group TaxID=214697 RepID=UPI0031D2E8FB
MASSLLSAAKTLLSPSQPRTPPPPPRAGHSFPLWSLHASRRSAVRVSSLKWEPSKVAPQADRVLIRLEELPEKSAGGVLLPKSAVKFERYIMGEVLSVGSDVAEVEAGKKVLFSDINAYELVCRWTWGQKLSTVSVKLVIC